MTTAIRFGGLNRALGLVRRALGPLRRQPGMAPAQPESDLAFWQQRVQTYGARSVLDLRHGDSEYESVTRAQQDLLLPAFARLLDGTERVVLDFGCGPGRFTGPLAGLGLHCVGVDPIYELLRLCPAAPHASYVTNTEGNIPLATHSVGAIWCCLVLGGLQEPVLGRTIQELKRVLRPGGLMFLVENTSQKAVMVRECLFLGEPDEGDELLGLRRVD
jgi:SAM-dependent methyltransferase